MAVLTHTPLWVAALFAVLVVLGVQALRPRRVALIRVFATPAVFVGWGLVSLALAVPRAPAAGLAWALMALVGGAAAFVTLRLEGVRAQGQGRVHLPGSILPLLLSMTIFAAKYALAAVAALHPAALGAILPWDMAVSGAAAGYFIGWTLRFLLAYRRGAPAALPVADSG
jgi:hypothetical protein